MTDVLPATVAAALAATSTLLARARGQRRVERLAQRLPREDGARLVRGAILGTHAGSDYRVRLVGTVHAVISVVCPERGRVRLSRRTRLDALCARLLPHERFASGDRRFDERVQVQTRDPVLAKRWLGRDAVRAGVLGFARRVPHVHLDGPRLKHRLPLARLTDADGVDALHTRVEKLAALAAPLHEQDLANVPPAAPKRDRAQRVAWALVLAAFGASVGALALAAGVDAASGARDADLSQAAWTVPAALLLALAALLALSRLVAGRSAPWRLLAPQALLLLLAGIFGGVAAAWGLALA